MSARFEHGPRDDGLPGRVTLNGRVVDRRTFLGALALTAAAAAAPLARVGLDGLQALSSSAALSPEGPWHVDDMWGHWPRYAHPISYTLVRHVPIDLDRVAPADRQFMM